MSHLYPLWGSHELTPDQPELWRAARVALEKRLAGASDGGCTFALAFAALSANWMGDGELAYDQLCRMLREEYYFANLLTGHYPNKNVLWIDGTGPWAEIVNGMLMRCWKGTLDLLPAVPKALPKGNISGILARNQITIERLCWDQPAGLIELMMTSGISQTITLRLPGCTAIHEIKPSDGESAVSIEPSPYGDNSRSISLVGNRTISLLIRYLAAFMI